MGDEDGVEGVGPAGEDSAKSCVGTFVCGIGTLQSASISFQLMCETYKAVASFKVSRIAKFFRSIDYVTSKVSYEDTKGIAVNSVQTIPRRYRSIRIAGAIILRAFS